MWPVFPWNVGGRVLELGKRTLIMGVVNVTPDSFSDGGLYFDCDRAVEHALKLLEDGADIIDVGGESTRPGARVLATDSLAAGKPSPTAPDPKGRTAVSDQEELDRVIPVIKSLKQKKSAAI